ncbi:MAG: MFS transporter [Candidatus Heimdallarchaeota archaeon]
MDKQRFPYGHTALISFGFFTSSLTWSVYNLYVPGFLASRFTEIFGEDAAIIYTLVAIVMVLDNVASIIIQPAIGHLSDKTWIPKLGRRMPFIILGIPLAAFFFGMIGSFRTTLWVLLVAISGFNISMAFYKSPVMSLVPDALPREYRSQGSGVLNVIGGIASMTGLVIVTKLLEIGSPLAFWSCSFIMIGCLIILVFSVKEKEEIDIEKSTEKINLFKAIKSPFKEGKKTLIIMLFSIFFSTAGYTVVETFIQPFTEKVLHFGGSTAGYILAVFVGLAVILAIPAGFVGQKTGALNACLIGLIGFIAAIIPLSIVSITSPSILADILTLNLHPDPEIKFTTLIYGILVLILAFSWLILSINSIVVIWNMAPKRKTATYTSYFYIFIHLAAVLSPLLAGGLFDLFRLISRKMGNEDASGLEIMFVYVAFCFAIALILVIIVKTIRTKKMKEIKDTDEYILKLLDEKEYPLLYLPMLIFGFGLRQEKALIELKQDQNQERKEMRQRIRTLKRELRKLHLDDQIRNDVEELLAKIEEIKSQREKGKELRKEHKEQRKDLKDELIKGKIKERLEKEKEETKQKNNGTEPISEK